MISERTGGRVIGTTLEAPVAAGEMTVMAAYAPVEGMPAGDWRFTWTWNASEQAKASGCINALTAAIVAEGDALFGCGGVVRVRLDGEA